MSPLTFSSARRTNRGHGLHHQLNLIFCDGIIASLDGVDFVVTTSVPVVNGKSQPYYAAFGGANYNIILCYFINLDYNYINQYPKTLSSEKNEGIFRMLKLLSTYLFIIFILPSQVWSVEALTAVYHDYIGDGISIAAKDAKTFRVEFLNKSKLSGEYLLILKNDRWFVFVYDDGADAVNMADLYKELSVTPNDLAFNSITITKTDRNATIFDIEGEVWEIEDLFWEGTAKTNEIVLTTNKDVALVTIYCSLPMILPCVLFQAAAG